MFVVTERAIEALDKLRASERPSQDQALGLVPSRDGRVGLVMDVPGTGDQTFSRGGRPVLFLDRALAGRFVNRVLDYVGEPGREAFVLGRSPG